MRLTVKLPALGHMRQSMRNFCSSLLIPSSPPSDSVAVAAADAFFFGGMVTEKA